MLMCLVCINTNYSSDQSKRLLALSCEELDSRVENILRPGLPCFIARDFNSNLSEPDSQASPRTTIVKGLFSGFCKY